MLCAVASFSYPMSSFVSVLHSSDLSSSLWFRSSAVPSVAMCSYLAGIKVSGVTKVAVRWAVGVGPVPRVVLVVLLVFFS